MQSYLGELHGKKRHSVSASHQFLHIRVYCLFYYHQLYQRLDYYSAVDPFPRGPYRYDERELALYSAEENRALSL